MNGIFVTSRLVIITAILSCIGGGDVHASITEHIANGTVANRMENITSDVDIRLTSEAKRKIKNYTIRYRQDSEELLGKVSIYFPLFEEELRFRGLPEELKFLPIVESALNPAARSGAGAVGLWQFMKSTGRSYNLSVDRYIDERKDPIKSTRSALDYLEDLHKQFGDWTLALAAYNCGPGNVRKAQRRSGKKSYWDIRGFLPKETRNYIPRFAAVAYLMNYYQDYGLTPNVPDAMIANTATTIVEEHTSFLNLSKMTGLDVALIKTLNPSYLRQVIPSNNGRHLLTLPQKSMIAILDAQDNINLLTHASYSTAMARRIKVNRRLVPVSQGIPTSVDVEKLERQGSLSTSIWPWIKTYRPLMVEQSKKQHYSNSKMPVNHVSQFGSQSK